jgi:hypothetical protein
MGSAHTPLTQTCPLLQSRADRQVVRQRRSDAHTNAPLHVARVQSDSSGNWQTVVPFIFTQLSPAGQSAVAWQASWHLLMLHARDWLQSLTSKHEAPTVPFVDSLQLPWPPSVARLGFLCGSWPLTSRSPGSAQTPPTQTCPVVQ